MTPAGAGRAPAQAARLHTDKNEVVQVHVGLGEGAPDEPEFRLVLDERLPGDAVAFAERYRPAVGEES
ncbi:hypothetical protein [Micromonospora sp. DT47]|uniref:hypothetical protein n=1 Tax=Micromonospora sp. DT47 TaxID=3393431 RepID=UPI003CF838F4